MSVPSSRSWAKQMQPRDLGRLSVSSQRESSGGSSFVLLFWLLWPPWALHGGGAPAEVQPTGGMDLGPRTPLPNSPAAVRVEALTLLLCPGYLLLFCMGSGSRVPFTARPRMKGPRSPWRSSWNRRGQRSLGRALQAAPRPLVPCRGKGGLEASQGGRGGPGEVGRAGGGVAA